MIKFRNYTEVVGITDDYYLVRTMLIKRGYMEFTYARWDWMITHSYLEEDSVSKIGLWFDDETLVGVVTFDCQPGETYLITLPGYDYLKKEMIEYAGKTFSNNQDYGIIVNDNDIETKNLIKELGYVATPYKEYDSAIFHSDLEKTNYTLPKDFKITDMAETFSLKEYQRVLWKGFNHEINKEGLFDESSEDGSRLYKEMIRPNVDLKLKIVVVAPDGHFASYCGMWYDETAGYAIIEPVATDPAYRKLGLGKAVVLEGVKRVLNKGAKFVVVGSNQQFYYSIGLIPIMTSTKWCLRETLKKKEEKNA